jgi:hypothetical protein
MNTIVRELPAIHIIHGSEEQGMLDREMQSSFFFFRVNLSEVNATASDEMTDSELIRAAAEAGTFRFLEAEEENRYTA